jgi:hypothetical protein
MSPLAERLARDHDAPHPARPAGSKPARSRAGGGRRKVGTDTAGDEGPTPSGTVRAGAGAGASKPARAGTRSAGSAGRARRAAAEDADREAPSESAWIGDLPAAERGRARRLIRSLTEAGVSDAEGVVRRDLVGGVPAVAALGIRRRLDALGPQADPAAVVDVLSEGRDDDLGVRWRIVDGDGRPIAVDPPGRARRR